MDVTKVLLTAQVPYISDFLLSGETTDITTTKGACYKRQWSIKLKMSLSILSRMQTVD